MLYSNRYLSQTLTNPISFACRETYGVRIKRWPRKLAKNGAHGQISFGIPVTQNFDSQPTGQGRVVR